MLWLVPADDGSPSADLGVRNEEGTSQGYRLVVQDAAGGTTEQQLDLAAGEEWREKISVNADGTTSAMLFRAGDSSPYRRVRLSDPGAGP